jgi:hypothetical protein
MGIASLHPSYVLKERGGAAEKVLKTQIWQVVSIDKARDSMDFQTEKCYISREDKP